MDKNKKEVLQDIARLLRYLGDLFDALVDEEPAGFNAEEIGTVVAGAVEPQITLEQVRSVLGDKSENGFTKEVRELLSQYGAKRLSQVNPKDYQALLKQAEALTNA